MWSGPNISVEKSEDIDEDVLEDDADKVRIAAFLSVRKVAMGSDESLLDMVLKVGAWFFLLDRFILLHLACREWTNPYE